MQPATLMLAIAWLSTDQASPQRESPWKAPVFDAVLRSVASEHCGNSRCYVSLDGKAPPESLARRLAGISHLHPLPVGGVPIAEREGVSFIDLFAARLRSQSHAEVSVSVSADMAGTILAFESCTYYAVRGATGWELNAKETKCLVL